MLDEGWIPSGGVTALVGVSAAMVGSVLTYLYRTKKHDDVHDINLGQEFRSRLEVVEVDLQKCREDHRDCASRLRALEVAQESRQQGEMQSQQILLVLREMATDIKEGRRLAVEEMKAHFKPEPPKT